MRSRRCGDKWGGSDFLLIADVAERLPSEALTLILVENLPGAMLTLVQILLVLMTVARHGLRNAHGPLVAPDLLIVYNGKLCAFADWYKAANHLVG